MKKVVLKKRIAILLCAIILSSCFPYASAANAGSNAPDVNIIFLDTMDELDVNDIDFNAIYITKDNEVDAADSNEGMDFESIDLGNGTVPITPYSSAKPTVKWNFNDGSYKFSGSATSGTLYTNYYFEGYDMYKVDIKNNHATKNLYFNVVIKWILNIWPVRWTCPLDMEPGWNVTFFVHKNMTTTSSGVSYDEKWALQILDPSNFFGTIMAVS